MTFYAHALRRAGPLVFTGDLAAKHHYGGNHVEKEHQDHHGGDGAVYQVKAGKAGQVVGERCLGCFEEQTSQHGGGNGVPPTDLGIGDEAVHQ